MKKYAVDKIYAAKMYNAGNKAHIDVSKTLRSCGYKVLTFKEPITENKWRKKVFWIVSIIVAYIKLWRADEVVFQFPGLVSLSLISKLKKKGIKLILLIHDAESIRGEAKNEAALFNLMDVLISHTPAMEQRLREAGVNMPKIVNLYLFDYYVSSNRLVGTENWRSIVFAGNLQKSLFLLGIPKDACSFPFYLYGKGYESLNPVLKYEGVFQPDDVSNIKGGWGLVWDGSSTETCDTPGVGQYLKYNSSHKISLYLVAGKPLILWKNSALAPFVEENKLGIVVPSIEDAIKIILEMREEEYLDYRGNVLIHRERILSGDFLRSAIVRCERLSL